MVYGSFAMTMVAIWECLPLVICILNDVFCSLVMHCISVVTELDADVDGWFLSD
jgi:hypothetical protein